MPKSDRGLRFRCDVDGLVFRSIGLLVAALVAPVYGSATLGDQTSYDRPPQHFLKQHQRLALARRADILLVISRT